MKKLYKILYKKIHLGVYLNEAPREEGTKTAPELYKENGLYKFHTGAI